MRHQNDPECKVMRLESAALVAALAIAGIASVHAASSTKARFGSPALDQQKIERVTETTSRRPLPRP